MGTDTSLSITEIIALFGLVGSFLTLLVGVWQYSKAQSWKRAEFVANEVKEMMKDRQVKNALVMLDWTARKVEFFPNAETPDARFSTITDDTLCGAFAKHVDKPRFTREEVAIRDTFDVFFDDLERFECFIESKLVKPKDFRPYLIYWIKAIAGEGAVERRREMIRAMWSYIDFYDFSGIQDLCARYGYDIKPSD